MGIRACVLVLVVVGAALAYVETPPLKNGGKHWAVLVAGSNTWLNYRHQVRLIKSRIIPILVFE